MTDRKRSQSGTPQVGAPPALCLAGLKRRWSSRPPPRHRGGFLTRCGRTRRGGPGGSAGGPLFLPSEVATVGIPAHSPGRHFLSDILRKDGDI